MSNDQLPDKSVSRAHVEKLAQALNSIGPDPISSLLEQPKLEATLRRWLEHPSCFEDEIAHEGAKSVAKLRLQK
jgi:hypothetical protein